MQASVLDFQTSHSLEPARRANAVVRRLWFSSFGGAMVVTDFDGETDVRSKTDLERRIATIRKGKHGAFILSHNPDGPSLWIHVCNSIAYLHYFPDPDFLVHAGYQATAMTLPGCPKEVRFRVIGGETITMPSETLVSLSDAIVAAGEFFEAPALPPSIEWLEL